MNPSYSATSSATAKPTTLPYASGMASLHWLAGPSGEEKQAAVYQQLQALVAQMPVPMYLLRGGDYVLELVNEPAAASWGCTPNQVRGQPFFEALPQLRGQGYEAVYATVWQTQQGATWQEAPLARHQPPGEPAVLGCFNVSFQPFYEVPGCLAGILVTSHDVTEQVLARQHLRQAAAELAATNAGLADYVTELTRAAHIAQFHAEAQATTLAQLLAQAPLAIGLLAGPDYVVQVGNPSLLVLWGCTLEQVLHQPLFEALPQLQALGLRELLDAVRRTGTPATAPRQLPGPGEGQGAVAVSYYPLRDAQGQTSAVAVIAALPG